MTLAVRVIPCLDVANGRVVKGVRFVGLRDAGDPVEAAARYDAEGADELVFLDITASHEDRSILLDIVAETATHCFMPVTVGGGVRTAEDVRALLKAGPTLDDRCRDDQCGASRHKGIECRNAASQRGGKPIQADPDHEIQRRQLRVDQ